MPKITDFPQGTPVWIDLQTTDRDEAAAFYSGVFGWQVSTPDAESGAFAIASGPSGPIAAIGPMPADLVEQGARGSWTVYLAVDDLDAVTAAVPEAGGRVVLAPGELGRGVRLGLAVDPCGAMVGLWQGGQSDGWARNEAGAADWFELVGAGADEALGFYETALGMTVTHMPMGETDYPMLAAGGDEIAGVDETSGGTVSWRVYFRVDDLDAARESIEELGGSMLTDTVRFDGVGAWAAARDPQGAVFSILQPPEPVAAADAVEPAEHVPATKEGTEEDD